MSNIKIVKLLTGEDILAKVLPSASHEVKIENPVRIVVMPNRVDPKTPSIGFAPWAEFSDEKVFTLDKNHVVAIMTPINEFVKQYTGMFSGIIINPNGPGLVIPGV